MNIYVGVTHVINGLILDRITFDDFKLKILKNFF